MRVSDCCSPPSFCQHACCVDIATLLQQNGFRMGVSGHRILRLGPPLAGLRGVASAGRGFGGNYLTRSGRTSTGHPQDRRPVRGLLHVVLKTSASKWSRSLVQRQRGLQKLGQEIARSSKKGSRVQVRDFRVGPGCIHAVVLVPSRKAYCRWIRAFCGRSASLCKGTRRGHPAPRNQVSFWMARPFSRILQGLQEIFLTRAALMEWRTLASSSPLGFVSSNIELSLNSS